MTASSPLIEAKHLYVSLDGIPVLRDVSIHVEAGEAVGLHGGNGSGKSTLIRTLVGLVPPLEGELRRFGIEHNKFKDWHRIGYVPQHSTIAVANATVREIVCSGRLPHRKMFRPMSKHDKQIVEHSLESVNLIDRIDWPFASLSGGQKQRTLIARALATQPELFIMDEPMAGVDLASQEGIAELLESLVSDGAGLLVVLHELGVVRLDRSITLLDGRVTTHVLDAHPEHVVEPPPESAFGWGDSLT